MKPIHKKSACLRIIRSPRSKNTSKILLICRILPGKYGDSRDRRGEWHLRKHAVAVENQDCQGTRTLETRVKGSYLDYGGKELAQWSVDRSAEGLRGAKRRKGTLEWEDRYAASESPRI